MVCLAERFNWFAFFLPPVWAAIHGLWREFILMLAALVAFIIVGNFFVLPAFSLYFIFALWLGFDASRLHALALARSGWQWQKDLVAPDRIMAEARFWQQQPLGGKQQ
ncbi:hypothetical protein MNBD_ALPHA12-1480 [hydrothermal vent metagenome]|uniref:Uncharacterized protein n=1 Tax=hydrothermal vent metagenome TaxID=652676 RepID=A0A3B0TWV1_9ZZZZ